MAVYYMLLKMTVVTMLYVILTVIMWKQLRDKEMTFGIRIAIGVLYGLLSILSTHFGINYGDMMLNVRDLGPMSAGLFFDPLSGIIAGLIGGVERYIAGTYWGVASYTRIACSISTILAGFLAAFLKMYVFKGKLPGVAYAAFMGSLIEVFHMYVVFITHRSDVEMAYYVVRVCALPMIFFSGLGLAASALIIKIICGEWHSPLKRLPSEEVPVSHRFQVWLFIVTTLIFSLNLIFEYTLQSQAALQKSEKNILTVVEDVKQAYGALTEEGIDIEGRLDFHVGEGGEIYIIDSQGILISDPDQDEVPPDIQALISPDNIGKFFTQEVYGIKNLCRIDELSDGSLVVVVLPEIEVYQVRDMEVIETILSDIVIFSIIYILISMLVQYIVVNNLYLVNESLRKITGGNLNEKVEVYNSSEFASLSADINQTVYVLKGYISAAEKRIEQELILARSIQEAALPKNFDFIHKGFEIFATMDPAREVGGDFYDFFFVDTDKIALVIADVSGKGIPAALFMMRSKTTIRGLAETGCQPVEVLSKTNNVLCEGNDASMFVTVWIGMIDLKTGIMKCVNAGHEYPTLMREGGLYELYKQKHNPALGFMEGMQYTEYELRFQPGDCLFVYTDGVPEAVNEQVEQYGTERMLKTLNENRHREMKELLPAVKADIDEFAGEADQFDDITMIGFRYNGMEA